MRRHARYGPTDRYLSPPATGMCISVFALIQRGPRVLVGRPNSHERWTSDWLFSWLFYPKDELEEALQEARLPSSYLWEGEDPTAALRRIMLDQLWIKKYKASAPKIFSYYSESDWYPGNRHWDLAIVYPVRILQSVKRPPWWKELGFVAKKSLRADDFGWNSDFAKDLGIVK